ncbi:MAG: hypothetical protein AB8F74_22470 [Saprospiraceae bacterium]
MKTIEQHWQSCIHSFTNDESLSNQLFEEIQKKYSQKSRAYHNLTHLKTMLDLSDDFEARLEDTALLRFSIFYHDLIYNSMRKDNELKSAERAKEVLEMLDCDPSRTNRCYHQILLTKVHQSTSIDKIDEKLLLDFDLEILSRDWKQYEIYTQQIRKEYWMYPKPLYRKGRRDAMKHFLEREYIYQTEAFRDTKEELARANILKEIDSLS